MAEIACPVGPPGPARTLAFRFGLCGLPLRGGTAWGKGGDLRAGGGEGCCWSPAGLSPAPSSMQYRSAAREIRQATVLCIGDPMLDDFVYGDVSRISPEAPALVIAVSARTGRSAGRQRRARIGARRALHLRRRDRRGRAGRMLARVPRRVSASRPISWSM